MNIFKLMQAMRPYIQRGDMTYDLAIKYLKERGVQFDGIVKKALDNMFKKIKARDPLFDKSVTKMPIDDAGIPFNPKTLKSTTEKRGVGNLFKKKADDVPWQETTAPFNPKAAAFYDDIVEESTALAKRTGKDVRSLIEERIGYKFTGNESMKEIIDIVEAKFFKADGGRIGYDIGGLTGQAKDIYDSWISAGHSSEAALDYLTSRGLYGNQEVEGIQTIVNTAPAIGGGSGGGDGQTGFGAFGNLDKSSKKTVMRDVWSEELGTAIPQPIDIYQDSGGMWKTYEGKNPTHAGINAKPFIGGILESVMGIDQDPTKFKEGQIMGTYSDWDRPWAPNYKDLNFIQKWKVDSQRNKELKDMQNKITADRIAREADLASIKTIEQHTGQPVSDYRMSRPASERRETVSYAPQGTTTFDTKSGMGRRDYADGGLATMFTRRR
jgi:hypothetical protein